jgi:hypothetical protein
MASRRESEHWKSKHDVLDRGVKAMVAAHEEVLVGLEEQRDALVSDAEWLRGCMAQLQEEKTVRQGLTFVHFQLNLNHRSHPAGPSKSAYVDPNSGRM